LLKRLAEIFTDRVSRALRAVAPATHTSLFKWKARNGAYSLLRRQNLSQPQTLSKKILFKMAWDRNSLMNQFADKIRVRDYIEKKIGPQYLVPLLGFFDSSEKISWESLPQEFAIKVSHGSGGVIVVSETATSQTALPWASDTIGWEKFLISPQNADSARIAALLDHWLSMKYEWWPGRRPEWAYRHVPPRIIIESLISGDSGLAPTEIKIFTVNGQARMLLLMLMSSSGEKKKIRLDRHWNILPGRFYEAGLLQASHTDAPSIPANLGEMIWVAETLGRGVDFIRVDLYDDSGQLRVGELTNYPFAGDGHYEPAEFDEWLGENWHPTYWRANVSRFVARAWHPLGKAR
jgi:hypothetical protein